jgi:hypothetical protein
MLARLVLVLAAVALAGFTPFTEVQNVCPTCEHPEYRDIVVLREGGNVWCNVVADNDEYYVLERHGELRAAQKSEVRKVEWGRGRGAESVGAGDQILLKNNVLYHGTILSEDPGTSFLIETPNGKQKPAVSAIASVHKAKRAYSFKLAPAPPPAPAAKPAPAPAAKPVPSAKPAPAAKPKAAPKKK